MHYGDFIPFDNLDFYDYGGCERFVGGEPPLIYRNVYDGSTIVYDRNGVFIEIFRDEPSYEQSDEDFTMVEFAEDSESGFLDQEVLDKLNQLRKQLYNLNFEEKLNILLSKFGEPHYYESPLIKDNTDAFNNWSIAKEIILDSKFIVYVDEEDKKLFNSKDELIEYVTDRFNDGSEKIKVQQISTNKTITLRRDDFV